MDSWINQLEMSHLFALKSGHGPLPLHLQLEQSDRPLLEQLWRLWIKTHDACGPYKALLFECHPSPDRRWQARFFFPVPNPQVPKMAKSGLSFFEDVEHVTNEPHMSDNHAPACTCMHLRAGSRGFQRVWGLSWLCFSMCAFGCINPRASGPSPQVRWLPPGPQPPNRNGGRPGALGKV